MTGFQASHSMMVKPKIKLIYLKTASTETLVDLILEGEIDDDDIPENKYAEVYAEGDKSKIIHQVEFVCI